MDLKRFFIIGALSAGVLVGCGSDSDTSSGATGNKQYSGITSEASISEENEDALNTSSIEVAKGLAVNVDAINDLPFGVQIDQSLSKEQVKNALNAIVTKGQKFSNLPIGASESLPGSCGGTATVSGTETEFTVTFNNYCEEDSNEQITFSGKAKGSISDTSEKFTFYGLTITVDGVSTTIVGTVSTTTVNNKIITGQDLSYTSGGETTSWISTSTCNDVYPYSCTYTETFTGESGITYKVEDYSISYDANGWDISGPEDSGFIMYDPNYGSLEVEANDLVYCTDGSNNFQSGEIVVTDSSGIELNIDFTACGVFSSSVFDPNEPV